MKKLSYIIVFCFITLLLVGCKKYDKNTTLTIEGEPLLIESVQETVKHFDDYSNVIYYRIRYKDKTLKSESVIGNVNEKRMLPYRFDVESIYKDQDIGFYSIIKLELFNAENEIPSKSITSFLIMNKQNNQYVLYDNPQDQQALWRKIKINEDGINILSKAWEAYE